MAYSRRSMAGYSACRERDSVSPYRLAQKSESRGANPDGGTLHWLFPVLCHWFYRSYDSMRDDFSYPIAFPDKCSRRRPSMWNLHISTTPREE
jgi:hypothetical protein